MKRYILYDNTFNTYFYLVWDCSEEEFVKHINKKYDASIECRESLGKIYLSTPTNKSINLEIWINKSNNIESLAHEILHAIRFWLQDYYHIPLNQETEEIYTMLHSHFMKKALIQLGLKKLTSGG